MPSTTIAILGAKGGVGTSLFSANLAIYLATIGKSVLAVDADPSGADLHAMLGIGPRVAPYVAPTPAFGMEPTLASLVSTLDHDTANTLPLRDPVDGPIPSLRSGSPNKRWISRWSISAPRQPTRRFDSGALRAIVWR